METLCATRAAKFVRPDVCVIGGLTACKKIAAVAEANYALIAPHNPLGPVSTAACMQLNACIPNFLIQEFPSFYSDDEDGAMTKESLQVEDGYILVSDAAGYRGGICR